MTIEGDPVPSRSSDADPGGRGASPITIDAKAVQHRNDLYLIPHSDAEHLDQSHSLIWLTELDASLPRDTLRAMLDDELSVSGRFSVQPSGFGDDGVLRAVLLEILHRDARPPPQSGQDPPGADTDQMGALRTLCRLLWARWSP